MSNPNCHCGEDKHSCPHYNYDNECTYTPKLKLTDNNEVIVLNKPIVLGDNGKRILQHLQDKKEELQVRVDSQVDKDKELEDAAANFVASNVDCRAVMSMGEFGEHCYKVGFKAAEKKLANEFKKDLLDAINHIDAIDCMVGISSTRTQDLEGVVEKLKLSLRNLRDIWQRSK